MKIIKNNFCQIFTSESSLNSYSLEFDNYCVGVHTFRDLDINSDFEIPTIIIGWDFIKNNFEKVRISKKKIKNNLYWTFSQTEDKDSNEKDIKKFITKSLNEFLPKNYETFDSVLNGSIYKKIDEILDKKISFVYLSKDVLYILNDTFFYGISLKSIDFIFENHRDFIRFIIERYKLIFFNYDNIKYYLDNKSVYVETLENICWACNNFVLTETSLYKFSPYSINEKYYVFFMSKFYDIIKCKLIDNVEILTRLNKKDFLTEWLSSTHISFRDNKKIVLKYSNKRTITGRINCVDKKLNIQLLPKNSEIRKDIVSEFSGGKIVIFDYVSFETKLSVYLTKDQIFIDKLNASDLHVETSKILFNKSDISNNERKVGKQINHAIIYGVGNDKLKSILQQNNLSIKLIDKIKDFLKPIIDNSKKLSENFKTEGYILNPYNTIIYPNKDWAVYNNYVQSIAADMVVDKLLKIKEITEKTQSNFMYQVYDSFVFDIHPDELELIKSISKILEKNGKYKFEVKIRIGNNLMECTEQDVEEEIVYIN